MTTLTKHGSCGKCGVFIEEVKETYGPLHDIYCRDCCWDIITKHESGELVRDLEARIESLEDSLAEAENDLWGVENDLDNAMYEIEQLEQTIDEQRTEIEDLQDRLSAYA